MNKVSIPKSIVRRVIARNGSEHPFDRLEPARTALVVIDMQNGYLLPGVAHSPLESAVDIVPNLNRLAAAVRETGGLVVWVQTRFSDESLRVWSVHYEMVGAESTERRRRSLSHGTLGYELYAGLDVRPEDLRVDKIHSSAFIQGSSDIEAVLRERGIDTVLITGTVTNVCCESSARDAMMRNFRTLMISDGNAARTDRDHNAALIGFYLAFGDVMSTDHAIERLRAGAEAAALV